MANPVAGVEKIIKLGLAIKDAVDTVRHNEEECNEIRRRVLRFSDILSQLLQTGMMNDSPAMSGALEDLEESLHRALERHGLPGEEHHPPPHRGRGALQAAAPGEG